jgi:hypothetical protein
VNSVLQSWSNRLPRLIYHDINSFLCSFSSNGLCSPYQQQLRAYVHAEHISYGAARTLGKTIAKKGVLFWFVLF